MPRRPRMLSGLAALLAVSASVAAVAGVGGVVERPAVEERAVAADPRVARLSREPVIVDADDALQEFRGAAASTTTVVDAGWKRAVPLFAKNDRTKSKCDASWSGGTDAAGRMYHACGAAAIQVRRQDGDLIEVVKPDEAAPIGRRDVAPSSDGSFVYYTVGDRQDTDLTPAQLRSGWGSIHRLKRGATGDYRRDAGFSVGPFPLYGGAPWSARYLTVGRDGTLYASVNAFIFAFEPSGTIRADENGQYDTAGRRIGPPIAGYDASGPAPGFNVIEGIAAAPDQDVLFAAEQDYDYIARFVRDGTGAWVADRIAGTPKQPSDSCTDSRFASPYDVAVDNRGSLYVADTTCGRIRQFDYALREVTTVLSIGNCNLCFKPHGLTVGGRGSLALTWRNELYARR